MNKSRSNFTPFVIISFLSIFIVALFLSNCTPSVSLTNIKESRSSKPADCELITYSGSSVLSAAAQVLGEISITDTGFSIQCDEAAIYALAREQACKLGADGIQILYVLPPDMSSTCYRIKARAIGLPSEYFERTGESTGTGFFVSSDGFMLTAQHVIEGAKKITVVLPSGIKKEAIVLKSSKSIDVALLKIEITDAEPLSLSNPGQTAAGDPVFTFGYPVVSVLGTESKYTDGSISSLSGIQDDATFMQITVPVQPGNSGGALANENGDVVGLITSTAASLPFLESTGNLPQNINWAVNADFIRPIIPTQSTAPKTRSKKEAVKAVKKATCLIVATW